MLQQPNHFQTQLFQGNVALCLTYSRYQNKTNTTVCNPSCPEVNQFTTLVTGVGLNKISPRATWDHEQKNLRAQPSIYKPNIICKSCTGHLNVHYSFPFAENRYSNCSNRGAALVFTLA